MGLSLSDSVTDDHYSSFVSALASARIFTALKAAGPLEDIEQPETPIINKDGQEQYTITPENTRQRIALWRISPSNLAKNWKLSALMAYLVLFVPGQLQKRGCAGRVQSVGISSKLGLCKAANF